MPYVPRSVIFHCKSPLSVLEMNYFNGSVITNLYPLAINSPILPLAYNCTKHSIDFLSTKISELASQEFKYRYLSQVKMFFTLWMILR